MKYLDIKAIRQEYKISQTELAKLVGKPQAYVSSVENKKRYATDQFIKKVAKVLKIKDMKPYITETPRKTIIRKLPNDLPIPGIENVQGSDMDSQAMIASLISIIDRCHEMIKAKDEEIARLRKNLGEKIQEIADMMARMKEEA